MATADRSMRLLIKEWRKARGLTQRQLARFLGISPATLSRYESGRIELRLKRAFDLAAVLQIQPSMLYPKDPDVLWTQVLAAFEDDLRDVEDGERVLAAFQHLRQRDPDTPLDEQRLYQYTRAWQALNTTFWYIICCLQAAAEQEGQRLARAITQPPAAPQADPPEPPPT